MTTTLQQLLAAARVAVAEAKRERDEWKLASSKNGNEMSGYQSRAIVAESRLESAKAERDAALAKVAELQRAIDEAFKVLDSGHGMLACREAAHILHPHATKANHSETPKSSPRPQCPPNVTIKQGEPPLRDAVFGPGCSPHPLDANPVGSEGTPQVSPVGKCCNDCDPVFRAAYGLDETPKPSAEVKAAVPWFTDDEINRRVDAIVSEVNARKAVSSAEAKADEALRLVAMLAKVVERINRENLMDDDYYPTLTELQAIETAARKAGSQ